MQFHWRRDTASDWTTANPTLLNGEPGYETDTGKFKLGDGSTAWTGLPYLSRTGPAGPAGPGAAYVPEGTRTSPNLITAVGGISIADQQREFQFIAGNAGPVVVTANPQIEPGTIIGQELLLTGTHASNTVSLANGTGLLLNGSCVLALGSTLYLIWDGNTWREISRNDI